MGQVLEALGLVHRQRPRADEAHRTPKHVEQLRQLIEAVAPEKSANRGDPGIVRHLEYRATHISFIAANSPLALLGIGAHRAKLKHRERPTVEPLRFCRNKTGPGDVNFTASAQISITGLRAAA